MTNLEPDDQEEKPLDPALENVRRKMVRLQIVSVAIMVVSLMAVFGAVVYKTMRPAPKAAGQAASNIPADAPVAVSAALPQGFTVLSTALSGNQVLFYGTLASGQRQAVVFDYGIGRIVATISLSN
ncbi:hypothetical protein ACXHXG_10745 [Rhizobium sp. LEGMi198b]|uniref:hypothetical protein n=1 Tax=unclassified Rhizobium TaxID=2613769 RepID=UPI000CDF4511|nr:MULTISPECIES: hypothetical protein [Rhizobium]AVA22615.1 hypothetical protein NXC24_CH02986 [Rhizobium sp. NXC24]MDK4738372.1 hypothetical protein [Rhizobium sp. CNPSo 3464]UWU19997.1 hypothetical protein N2601_11855 [Rhizobium tropici]WFU00822.1 hypothetical protein QA648_11680 [Rhizobium sp. CB3171]